MFTTVGRLAVILASPSRKQNRGRSDLAAHVQNPCPFAKARGRPLIGDHALLPMLREFRYDRRVAGDFSDVLGPVMHYGILARTSPSSWSGFRDEPRNEVIGDAMRSSAYRRRLNGAAMACVSFLPPSPRWTVPFFLLVGLIVGASTAWPLPTFARAQDVTWQTATEQIEDFNNGRVARSDAVLSVQGFDLSLDG